MSGGVGTGVRRLALRLPRWLRTVRVRLALTYSSLLFGVTALLLAGVYLALSSSISAAPLDPVTVKKFETQDGHIVYKPGQEFQAADFADVQEAVNYASLQTLRNYSIIALVVMFVLSLAIGWWVAGRALRPVGAITRTAQEINASDLTRRIGATGPHDELRTLADTIDSMLARLDKAFTDQRRFVEDVSHELRNPVSLIHTNVEAVLANDRSTPTERREASVVVLQATRRMRRLLEDLLAIARSRSEAFTDRQVDLSDAVTAAVREHRLAAEARGLRMVERSHRGPVVVGDPDALQRALANLLSNAVRLAPTGSTITIGMGGQHGWAWAAVADEGPGIAEADRERIFDRFYRGNGAAGQEPATDGSGLGLAIARQIAESHEGRLVLVSRGTAGSTFVLWLPDHAMNRSANRTDAPPEGDPLLG
ncbi:HAMP domain-containing histidine kinase [Nocardioides sp. KC13]|uniref:histidine kinase n=1 Tax=Nocardioides turkmenicus TaxID=2711220 RepID=A0A6M1QZ66_9ACTN|nr:HAMP domain-containing sensor histidine kinase [Nocardioides sp. KC13]NGN95295.1 HAMP domain-containing histidine kinase [Nocardioides sp. KC13]